MASPLAVYKLTILYMLELADGEIPVPMISAFLLENGFTGFSSLVQTYSELEESGLVRSRTEAGERAYLRITEEGEETLHFFAAGLSDEIKRQVKTYLKDQGRALRSAQSLSADYDRNRFGDYEVRLCVREKEEPVVDILLTVPDQETAAHVAAKWKEANQEIYEFLIQKLF